VGGAFVGGGDAGHACADDDQVDVMAHWWFPFVVTSVVLSAVWSGAASLCAAGTGRWQGVVVSPASGPPCPASGGQHEPEPDQGPALQ